VGSLYICRRIGQNVKAWFKKKGEYNDHICFESNLTKVSHNAWWIDSGCMPHVSNMMQRFISTQTINPNAKCLFLWGIEKIPVESIGTYDLILDTELYLDLLDTFYVPSISRNLVSLSKLHVVGYSFKFGNSCFSLYKCTCMIGFGTIFDGLYKLNLDNLYVETLMTLHHSVDNKYGLVDEVLLTCGINVWDIFPKKWWKD